MACTEHSGAACKDVAVSVFAKLPGGRRCSRCTMGPLCLFSRQLQASRRKKENVVEFTGLIDRGTALGSLGDDAPLAVFRPPLCITVCSVIPFSNELEKNLEDQFGPIFKSIFRSSVCAPTLQAQQEIAVFSDGHSHNSIPTALVPPSPAFSPFMGRRKDSTGTGHRIKRPVLDKKKTNSKARGVSVLLLCTP